MLQAAVAGTIVDKKRKSDFEWIIPAEPLSRVWQKNQYLQSPPFYFLRSSWNLRFYPNVSGSFVCLVRDDITNKDSSLTLSIGYDICYKRDTFVLDSKVHTFYKDCQIYEILWDDLSISKNQWFSKHRNVNTVTTIKFSVTTEHPETMDKSSFCTRQFFDDFDELCMNDRRSDVKILVGEEPYKIIPAHKLILEARCPMLNKMLLHNMGENILYLDGYDENTVRIFLKFLYTGKLKMCSSYKSAECLYRMANYFGVADLKIRSRQLIEQYMHEDIFCDILSFADMVGDSLLKISAKVFAKHNSFRIFPTKRWGEFRIANKSLANEIFAAIHIT